MGVRLLLDGIPHDPAWSRYTAGAGNLGGLFSSIGEFFGITCGVIMAARWARFEVIGPLWKRGLAGGYAVLGPWSIKEVFRMIPMPQTEELRLVFNFVRGAILNWWILFPAPWVVLKANLLRGPNSSQASAQRH